MARRSRTAVLKRQREAKKAEKAQMKRDKRQMQAAIERFAVQTRTFSTA